MTRSRPNELNLTFAIAAHHKRSHCRGSQRDRRHHSLRRQCCSSSCLSLGAQAPRARRVCSSESPTSRSPILAYRLTAQFDVDGSLYGYMSDFTRTMLPDIHTRSGCGRSIIKQVWPSPRAKKIWKTVRKAQQVALDSLDNKDGRAVYAADPDRAARELIAEAGWGSRFTHRLGHGIGLQVVSCSFSSPS